MAAVTLGGAAAAGAPSKGLQMSYSLNSLKGDYIGRIIGDIEGDSRSLDYGTTAQMFQGSCKRDDGAVAELSSHLSILLRMP